MIKRPNNHNPKWQQATFLTHANILLFDNSTSTSRRSVHLSRIQPKAKWGGWQNKAFADHPDSFPVFIMIFSHPWASCTSSRVLRLPCGVTSVLQHKTIRIHSDHWRSSVSSTRDQHSHKSLIRSPIVPGPPSVAGAKRYQVQWRMKRVACNVLTWPQFWWCVERQWRVRERGN